MKVIITGASSGIGAAIAKEFSSKGWTTILVARTESKLKEVQKVLPNKSEIVLLDLSIPANNDVLIEKYKDDLDVKMIINNAGYGNQTLIYDADINKEQNMINILVNTTHYSTLKWNQVFKERGEGTIVNVASVAGFSPLPLMATYSASKAFVRNFSIATAIENKANKTGVNIRVITPGSIRTDFWDKLITDESVKMPGTSVHKFAKHVTNKLLTTRRIEIRYGHLSAPLKVVTKLTGNKVYSKLVYKFIAKQETSK